MASPPSANSPTWWSLMDNSDSSDDDLHFRTPDIFPATTGTSRAQPSHSHSNSRRSSAPLPQPFRSSPGKANNSHHRNYSTSHSNSLMTKPSRRSLGTPRSQPSRSNDRRSSHDRYHENRIHHSSHPYSSHHRHHHHHHDNDYRHHSSALGPSLDEEDPEKRKIRWEEPTTHNYQLTEQPRLLEERFMNVMDAMPNMVCSAANLVEKPPTHSNTPSAASTAMGGAAKMVWSLMEANRMTGQGSDTGNKEENEASDDNHSTDSGEEEDSIFQDGPSVVEISAHQPALSESITASESLLSSEASGIGGGHGGHSSASYSLINDPNNPPADSSQILDDLSGMESELDKVMEHDTGPLRPLPPKQEHQHERQQQQQQQKPIVVNHDNRPPVKIYNTSMPFEMATMEKSCLLSMSRFQDMQKTRTNAVTAKNQYEMNKKAELAHKKRLKDHPNVPPIPDISIGESHEISTISASEDSNMYRHSNRAKQQQQQQQMMLMRNEHRNQHHNPVGSIPENAGLPVEAAVATKNTMLLFDNSFQDETRSCMPNLLQRNKRRGDMATVSSSSRSMGLRLLSRSADANTTAEKENESKKEEEEASPYVYEYESGANTYVAYFEASKSREICSALQVIEHPNPPLLPFGSNEIVVKIEASTISQSDCAIRRGEWWGGTLSLPRIPGVAFAGRIDQVHKTGRNGMQKGDQVLSLVCSGSNSRYVCIPRDRLVRVQSNQMVSSAKLTCLPEIYLSAFQALHHGHSNSARYRKNSLAGKAIMFAGGATSFGQALIELAIEAGASVVYATATKVKQFQRIIELGGIPLSDNPAEWLSSINQQVDLLIGCGDESVRDVDPLTYDHFNVLKKKGQLVLLGGPGPANDYPVIHPGNAPSQVDVFKILKRAHKHNVFENWENDMKQGKKDLTHLIGLLHKGVLNPKILERIPLSKVSKAEDIMEARRLHGVIICEPWILENQRIL